MFLKFKMADKVFKICRSFRSSYLSPYSSIKVICKAEIQSQIVWMPLTRCASRLSTITKPTDKSKQPQEKLKIRPRIKSLAKEDPPEKEQNDLLCLTYSTSEQYHLLGLRDTMNTMKDKYIISNLPKDARDVLYVCTKQTDDNGIHDGEIFFFRLLGAIVFWNFKQEEIQNIRKIIKRFEDDSSYKEENILEESEEIPYSYSKNQTTTFTKGRIVLNENESEQEKALQKFAFSNAIALSVKLGIWESELEKYIDSLAWVPDALSKGVKLTMSRKEILEKTGELISLRYKINLYSDLLMTPDFYWDREELGILYESMCSYMEVRRRTKVMNEKLNHCGELAELLRSHLSERHSFTLEWGIIILIAIELILSVPQHSLCNGRGSCKNRVLFETIHLVETHMPIN